jgi:CHASE2 domain-containing sensor protein
VSWMTRKSRAYTNGRRLGWTAGWSLLGAFLTDGRLSHMLLLIAATACVGVFVCFCILMDDTTWKDDEG